MRSFLGYFLNPAGLVVLGILDSSLVFFLPLGIDVVLIILSARHPELFWMYALAATAGSLIGAGGTYWLGHKVGQEGIARWIGESRLRQAQHRVGGKAATGVAVLGLIPPPFPFTALVLASGAFALDAWRFFVTLALVRAFRFGLESAMAARYGQRILAWMESPVFEFLVGALVALALAGTVISAVVTFRKSRRRSLQ